MTICRGLPARLGSVVVLTILAASACAKDTVHRADGGKRDSATRTDGAVALDATEEDAAANDLSVADASVPDVAPPDVMLPDEAVEDAAAIDSAVADAIVDAGPCAFTPAAKNHWDAVRDFSATCNPFGPWSWGWTATLGSSFTPFSQQAGNAGWVDPSINVLGTPGYWKNLSSGTLSGVKPGEVSLHPGCHAQEYAVLRWTAPLTARCTVTAVFFAGDIQDTDAAILKNSTETLVGPASTATEWQFIIGNMPISTGDTLDFVVGTKGDCYYDNTPITVTITCP